MNFVELFSKGDPIICLLLLTSIAVAVIGLERFRFYKYADNDGEKFLKSLVEKSAEKNFEEVLNFCRKQNGLVGEVARSGMNALAAGKNVELALNMTYDEAAMKLRARLNYLSMIVTLAPLLGLLGTIFGMMQSFNIFAVRTGQPLEITGGIGEALTATATGLCVAIFALLVHTYLAQKLDEILSRLEKASAIILSIEYERNKNL